MEILDGKDPELWKIAQKRASFKRHLTTYLIINGFFWLIWFMGRGHYYGGLPWPVWPMLGWGIGLAFNYFDAYQGDKNTLAEREYEKMKKERENKN